MEKITQEVFRSGTQLFLTEAACLAYEKKIRDTKNVNDIINFLVEEGFSQSLADRAVRLKRADKYFTTYEFLFISDSIYIYKHIEDKIGKPEERLMVYPAPIQTFKMFYFDMLQSC